MSNFNYQEKNQKQWREQLESEIAKPRQHLKAIEYTRSWRTKSEPILLECEDNQDYVVKTQRSDRQIINDQLVARLGQLLEAPVGEPKLIHIPQELIDYTPNLKNISPGIAHGTLWIPNCFDDTLMATSEPQNRLRLVLLATLYGWTYANDHQFLYNRQPPRLIYSVDHGHFFPNPPNWCIDDLGDLLDVSPAVLDNCFQVCNFSQQELIHAYEKLNFIDIIKIIQSVAIIPSEWGFTMEERLAMIEYLVIRQKQLLQSLELDLGG